VTSRRRRKTGPAAGPRSATESGILGDVLIARRLTIAIGSALLAAAAVLMLWPLHANGVSGNAAQPHYSDFGWYSYTALPAHPTHADFVRAGITTPQDVVHDRRVLSAGIAAGGAAMMLTAAVALRKRRD
jgi:hypothetical protein